MILMDICGEFNIKYISYTEEIYYIVGPYFVPQHGLTMCLRSEGGS